MEQEQETPHSRKRDRLLVAAEGSEDRWAGEHRSALDRIRGFLGKDPNSQVELVAVGSAATSARANLLSLLTKSGPGVTVCSDVLRVWRPRGAPGLQGLRQANKSIRHARGRGRKLR